MALTDAEKLRELLGEEIPAGGTASDTLFTDESISQLLSDFSFDDAVLEGWKRKTAKLSTLVDTIEGASRRAMSDAHKNAMKQLEFYQSKDKNTARTRIGRIVRP